MKPVTLSFKPDVPVIDANVRLGHFSNEWSEAATVGKLLAAMDKAGIGTALAYHAHAMSISPLTGTTLLDEAVKGQSRLYAQHCFLPTRGDLLRLQTLRAQSRLSSVRLSFERGTPMPFVPAIYGEILEWLEQEGIPLWTTRQAVSLQDLAFTCGQFKKLKVVLLGTHYSDYLFIPQLMRAIPNMHMETSRYEVFGDLEKLVAEFGAERFIYGSSYPDYVMGPMLFYLHRCDFSSADLAAICAGNLLRLLGIGGNK